MAGPGNALIQRRDMPRGPTIEDRNFELQRQERERLRATDPDSIFNDYLAGRSYNGADDPFMSYLDNLEGRQNWQRERRPLDPRTLEHLQNYMDIRRRLIRPPGRSDNGPPTS